MIGDDGMKFATLDFIPIGRVVMSTQDMPTVFIVDDDIDVRESLQELLESVGLQSKSFGTAREFLSASRSDCPSCLILDVRLPGISGLEPQQELKRGKVNIPIIFLTAHAYVRLRVWGYLFCHRQC